jgi:hypothetical protein
LIHRNNCARDRFIVIRAIDVTSNLPGLLLCGGRVVLCDDALRANRQARGQKYFDA